MPRIHHILITGASSGVGAALALAYARRGMSLSLHGRDHGRLSHVADAARSLGSPVSIHQGDVTNTDDMSAWIEHRDQESELSLVIANAGISAGTLIGIGTSLQARHIFETNVGGVINTVQPAALLMKARRRGQIAVMSSLAGFRGLSGASSYCASKAAVRIYGEALRAELAPDNVAVNVICPGFIDTPLTRANTFAMPFLMSPEKSAEMIVARLARNDARIAFPWPMYAAVRVYAGLPPCISDRLSRRLPKKG